MVAGDGPHPLVGAIIDIKRQVHRRQDTIVNVDLVQHAITVRRKERGRVVQVRDTHGVLRRYIHSVSTLISRQIRSGETHPVSTGSRGKPGDKRIVDHGRTRRWLQRVPHLRSGVSGVLKLIMAEIQIASRSV